MDMTLPSPTANPLESLNFTRSFLALGETFYSRVAPQALSGSHLISVSDSAAKLVDLSSSAFVHPELLAFVSGQQSSTDAFAMVYAGHQFGHFVRQLGDGRAIMLGEVTNRNGERWELQLKGAGLTPYSRDGDGRAVLRSSIREYLCSEAMHGLGIPTTRALCITGSNEEVYREQIETGAMVVRMAPSHVRFGSFEYFYHRGEFAPLQQLADYLIEFHYPQLRDESNPYLALYREVVTRTARLVAQWQLVGFAHGVLNTDNMSMLGLTLDYGPFGFLDDYDPGYICNHSDHYGRYAFNKQPDIGLWNLSCLGQAMLPLLAEDGEQAAEMARAQFDHYQTLLNETYSSGLNDKLGLKEHRDGDLELGHRFLDILASERRDFTLSFRNLSRLTTDKPSREQALRDDYLDRERFDQWATDYQQRLQSEKSRDDARRARMNAVNPKFVLRNYLAQQAIDKAQQGDYREIDKLMVVLSEPYAEHEGFEQYAEAPPDWGKKLSVSCSS